MIARALGPSLTSRMCCATRGSGLLSPPKLSLVIKGLNRPAGTTAISKNLFTASSQFFVEIARRSLEACRAASRSFKSGRQTTLSQASISSSIMMRLNSRRLTGSGLLLICVIMSPPSRVRPAQQHINKLVVDCTQSGSIQTDRQQWTNSCTVYHQPVLEYMRS
jgi:hypothetical protein